MTQEYDLGYIRGATGPVGPAGPTGATGAAGAAGPTPSISIGQVTTVQPGQQPYVSRRSGSPDQYPILDFGLPAASGDMEAAVYDPLSRHQDVFAYCDNNSGRRSSTVVVAAADSREQARADFVCDGVADHITIRQALAALPQAGGQLLLLEGSYYLDLTGIEDDGYGYRALISVSLDNVTLKGQGRSTRLILADGAAEADSLSLIEVSGAGFAAEAFCLDGNKAQNDGAGVYGLTLLADADDAYLTRLLIQNCSLYGAHSLCPNLSVDDCLFSGSQRGLSIAGSKSKVRSCRFEANDCGLYTDGGSHIISQCTCYDSTDKGFNIRNSSRCRICDNILTGQPVGIYLYVVFDSLISGNIIYRTNTGYSGWGDNEYPLRVAAGSFCYLVNNLSYGRAPYVTGSTYTALYFSGTDWNPAHNPS